MGLAGFIFVLQAEGRWSRKLFGVFQACLTLLHGSLLQNIRPGIACGLLHRPLVLYGILKGCQPSTVKALPPPQNVGYLSGGVVMLTPHSGHGI